MSHVLRVVLKIIKLVLSLIQVGIVFHLSAALTENADCLNAVLLSCIVTDFHS